MITRAYQNSKNERQEVSLNAANWEVLTEGQLQSMLGFNDEAPKAAPAKPKAKGK
jgi:hypothetical protein